VRLCKKYNDNIYYHYILIIKKVIYLIQDINLIRINNININDLQNENIELKNKVNNMSNNNITTTNNNNNIIYINKTGSENVLELNESEINEIFNKERVKLKIILPLLF